MLGQHLGGHHLLKRQAVQMHQQAHETFDAPLPR
jgi:hypothetical protein